jgi:uncharacterized membrane protein SpoIIM required for sporulation/uncharacterized RDD family membrane protein YckC
VSDRPGPDFVTIETPEHATFTYEVAGLVSRGLAALIDHAIQVVLLLGLFLVFAIGALGAGQGGFDEISKGMIAALVLGVFVIIWAYFVVFELLWRGQTPGKRLVGIRVIRDGGYGVTAGSILTRNLFRFVGDLMPFPLVGIGVMFGNARCKRLGDFVAGTIVVRDTPTEYPPGDVAPARPDENLLNDLRRAGIHRLRQEYAQAIESFLARADEFEPLARMDVAHRLAEPLSKVLQIPVPDPERLLRHVAAALRQSIERRELKLVHAGRGSWSKLDALAARLHQLTTGELLELVAVYRRTTGDLARAKTLKARTGVVDYLNRLVGRIHFRLYTTPGFSSGRFLRFFTHVLPQTVRRNAGFVVAATLMLIVPAVMAYVAVSANPVLLRVFAPPQFVELIDQYGEIDQRGVGEMTAYTSFYISNNVQVSFFTFATGIAFGLGSFYFLVSNGAILGAMLAGVAKAGAARPFLSFVSTHGGIEMFAIVLAGAAGLRLGAALVNPGDLTRGRALLEGARDAGVIMFGVILMLLVAAVLEAWVSPSPNIPDVVKWVAGVVNLTWIIAYYVLVGRVPKPA